MDNNSFDGTEIASVIFSCIQSINERFGVNYVASVLVGSKSQKIQKFGHQNIPSYGKLDQYSTEEVKDFIKQLIKQGFLYKTQNEYPVIRLLDKANFIAKQESSSLIQLGTDKILLQKPDPTLARKVRISLEESVEKTIALFKEGKSVMEITQLLRQQAI